MTPADWRKAKLSKLARRFGLTLEQLAYKRRLQAEAERRANELRWDRFSAWPSIAIKAAAHGRCWEVL